MILCCLATASISCVLSKISEKIIYNRVTIFLERYQILHGNQHGFRKNSCNSSTNWWWSHKSIFLGVIIINKLSWKDHVSFLCRNIARGIGVIIKARKVLRIESLKRLYSSFIYPYVTYCNQVWRSMCITNIELLLICCSSQVSFRAIVYYIDMMTSSNGNIFRVTGHLCGEFTGPRWIPRTKASDVELWCFLWSVSE